MAESNQDSHIIRNGFALVIVNKLFRSRAKGSGIWLPDRPGAEHDKANIENFCENAGLTVNDTDGRRTVNLKAKEMENLFVAISERDFRSNDAFICFISSHGDTGGIYGVDGEVITVDDIVSQFRDCSSLAGKPKLFFVQNCRGREKDQGVMVVADNGEDPPSPIHLPIEADILVAYSSSDGYESYRNLRDGSWFITKLTGVLNEHARNMMNLTDMLAIVNKNVADMVSVGRKQMPCFTSTLRKLVYFKMISVEEL